MKEIIDNWKKEYFKIFIDNLKNPNNCIEYLEKEKPKDYEFILAVMNGFNFQ